MKHVLLPLLFCIGSLLSGAQELNADSLRRLLAATTEDTAKVILSSHLSRQLQRSNPDSAFLLGQQGLHLSQKMGYKEGIIYCTAALAGCWWSNGEYATAIKMLLPYVKAVEETKNPAWIARYYADLYNAYRDQGDYEEALKYAYKLLPTQKAINQGQYYKVGHAAIAVVYLELHHLDSAQAYIQKALTMPPSFGLDGWIYSVAERIMTAWKRFADALGYYRQSMRHLLSENNLKDLAGTCNNVATLFQITGQKDSAIVYARQSLLMAESKQFVREKMEASLILSNLYEPLNTDSAFFYHKTAMTAKDSLYNQEKQRQVLSYKFNEELRQQEESNLQQQYRNNLRFFAVTGILLLSAVIGVILYRSNRHRLRALELLQKQKLQTERQKTKAEEALFELKQAQAQLVQKEKMASLGELTAGIAHEIQNPLNFVNNFSEANRELIEELEQANENGEQAEVKALAANIRENEEKIVHHGKRADSIVKSMVQHARPSGGKKEPTDINKLTEDYLRLSYQAMRVKDKAFTYTVETHLDTSIGEIPIVPQDIGRVLLNLFNNAFYSVQQKKANGNSSYEPLVQVSTCKQDGRIKIAVKDNGTGMPEYVVDKVFQPFFTTKPTGEGTGLGLSLSYDIITKGHDGEMAVETKEGEFTAFSVRLNAGENKNNILGSEAMI